MSPYEESDQVAYETSVNDVMDYATPAVYDGGDVVRFEWTDNQYQEPYEYYTRDAEGSAGFGDTHSPISIVANPGYVDGENTTRDIDDVEMTLPRRHESWSDESSYYDDVEGTPLNRDSATRDSCLHESRVRADTSNLKHVFVDVHRSMTCSCDNVRNSQFVLDSDKAYARHNHVTKHISFRAYPNQYFRGQNSSKIQHNSILLSLALSSERRNRRYSV